MATLLRTPMQNAYNPSTTTGSFIRPTNGAADVATFTTNDQQVLKQYLVAREKIRFFEDYFASRHQQYLDDFTLNFMAQRMYSTDNAQAQRAAGEIQAACSTFHAEASQLNSTIKVLATVRERLDEHIEAHVRACGHDAACVLERHIAQVQTDLTVTETKREDVATWLTTLNTLLTNVETVEVQGGQSRWYGRAGFGTEYTAQPSFQTTSTTIETTEKVTETAEAKSASRASHKR